MSQSSFSQPQVSSSSTYCFKTKMKHRPHPYTIQMPQLHETGDKSSIADLTTELAGLMLALSHNVQGVKRPQHHWSSYSQHQQWKKMKQSFLHQQQQVSPLYQKVANTVHTWKGLKYSNLWNLYFIWLITINMTIFLTFRTWPSSMGPNLFQHWPRSGSWRLSVLVPLSCWLATVAYPLGGPQLT